jgi:GWxTD domain-containing protein
MKKIIVTLSLLLIILSTQASIRAFLSYTTYNSPSEGPYMETYLSVNGKSVNYKRLENGKYQANLQIIFTFERNDSIISFQKIALNSPEINSLSDDSTADFIDVERFFIPTGTFNFNISIEDLNSKDVPIKSNEMITIGYPKTKASLSGIQLASNVEKSDKPTSMTKHGYNVYPYFNNFYPDFIHQITFYFETYNTKAILGENNTYIVRYYLEDANKRQKLGAFIKQKKMKTSEVDINFGNFNIAKLPSGNYNLVAEILDTTEKVLAFNSVFLQRSNPKLVINNTYSQLDITNTFVEKITNFDTLRTYLSYLYPILDDQERVFSNSILLDQKQNADSIYISAEYRKQKLFIMQQFFLDFWKKRNSLDPEKEWNQYMEKVAYVNYRFGSLNQKGYISDRGRVYLQYGAPNSVSAESMGADSYPYEIWHYYLIKGQGNCKFVFYNIDRVSNSYELLHSDVFGEINEPEWEKILRNRRESPGSHDTKTAEPGWGDHSRDYWNNPR